MKGRTLAPPYLNSVMATLIQVSCTFTKRYQNSTRAKFETFTTCTSSTPASVT